MTLSEMAARTAKATGKVAYIDGLSLAVTAQSGRTWRFRYCWAGKQKRMSCTYPEVDLPRTDRWSGAPGRAQVRRQT